jgi:16S rRNA processing protein RimM
MSERWVEVGRIGAPHGVRGWTKVQSFMNPPAKLLEQSAWQLRFANGTRQTLEVSESRVHGEGWVAKLIGVDDRDAAQRLTGALIEVARKALPPPGEREHYLADLVGMQVRNAAGVELGVIDHFLDAPGNDVMVVCGAREHWVPVTKQHLLQVDVAARTVVVDWPEDF